MRGFEEKERTPKTVAFSSLGDGSLFIYNGRFFIHLAENSDISIYDNSDCSYYDPNHHAVDLSTGKVAWFSWEDPVIPIDGTLTYERI